MYIVEYIELVSLLLVAILVGALGTSIVYSDRDSIESIVADHKPILEKYTWRLVKSNPASNYYTDSPAPRILDELYRVNVTTNIGGVLAVPLVDEDLIVLADGEGVYTLNSSSGELLWGVEVFFDDLHARAIRPLQPVSKWRAIGLWRLVLAHAIGKAVYVATDSGEGSPSRLIAIDRESGAVLWITELGEATYSNIVVANGRVYVGTMNGTIYCVSEDGELLWSSTIEERGFVRGLAYGDGILYVSLEDSYYLYALNATTGETIWVYRHNSGVSTPEYSNGIVVFADASGRVVALSSSGEVLWSRDVGAASTVNGDSLLAVDRSYVYAAKMLGEERGLVVLSRDSGSIVSTFYVEEGLVCQPAIAGPLVILPIRTGQYAKIYILWRGSTKLDEKVFRGEEVFCPSISVARGRINIVYSIDRSIQTLVSFTDNNPPVIVDVSGSREIREGEKLLVEATVVDKESAIYRVLLLYRVDSGEWSYKEMELARRYVVEPVGGYGFSEEPYRAAIPGQKRGSTIEYLVVAIDNIGNIAYSETYRAIVVDLESTTSTTSNTTTTTTTTTPTTTESTTTTPETTTPERERTRGSLALVVGVAVAVLVGLVLTRLWRRSIGR